MAPVVKWLCVMSAGSDTRAVSHNSSANRKHRFQVLSMEVLSWPLGRGPWDVVERNTIVHHFQWFVTVKSSGAIIKQWSISLKLGRNIISVSPFLKRLICPKYYVIWGLTPGASFPLLTGARGEWGRCQSTHTHWGLIRENTKQVSIQQEFDLNFQKIDKRKCKFMCVSNNYCYMNIKSWAYEDKQLVVLIHQSGSFKPP